MKKLMLGTLVAIALMATVHLPVSAAGVPPVISYQGKLMLPTGAPVPDGTKSIVFSIYDVPTGGTPVWTETNNSVQVKGGLFSVMLGSVNPIAATVFASPDRYFGIKVDADTETTPRQKIASVAYAQSAGSAETAMTALAANTATTAGSATTADNGVPVGGIIMWSGAATAIPTGWKLCDGANGTPNLRDRFIVGSGGTYAVGATGGENSHQLTITEMPSHTHDLFVITDFTFSGNRNSLSAGSDQNTGYFWDTTGSEGGNQPHENRPPYYALCFIMKVAG